MVVVADLYDHHCPADLLHQPGILRCHSDDDRKLLLLCVGPLQRGWRLHRSVECDSVIARLAFNPPLNGLLISEKTLA